jgi:hypothetical protein
MQSYSITPKCSTMDRTRNRLLAATLTFLFLFGSFWNVEAQTPSPDLVKRKLQIVDSLNALPDGVQFKNNNMETMITGPEQDCSSAIPICQQSYFQANSYTGYGTTKEIGANSNNSNCLLAGERQSVWYTFTVQNSGTFTFTINTSNDYDYSLYNTGGNCNVVGNVAPVRCNFSADYGSTGLNTPVSGSAQISYSASDAPFMPGLNVVAGQTYVLVVDNYTQAKSYPPSPSWSGT